MAIVCAEGAVTRRRPERRADPSWLQWMITRRVPMSDFAEGLHKKGDDVKIVVDLRA